MTPEGKGSDRIRPVMFRVAMVCFVVGLGFCFSDRYDAGGMLFAIGAALVAILLIVDDPDPSGKL